MISIAKKSCAVALSSILALSGFGILAPSAALAETNDPDAQTQESDKQSDESSGQVADVDAGEVPVESDGLDSVSASKDDDATTESGKADEGNAEADGSTEASDEKSQEPQSEASESEAVYYANDEGEYAYIPSDALTLDEVSGGIMTMAATSSEVVELGGEDRYETVAKEAQYAFASCDTAVVASGVGYADSIAAAGLAGALNCPILLTNDTYVPDVTKQALSKLGVKKIILLGSTDVANNAVFSALKSIVGSSGSVERVYGKDRYETQMAIFNYGQKRNLWGGDYAIISAATGFADALSISPVSYALRAPVFFCDGSRSLPSAQKKALSSTYKAKNILVTGSNVVVSDATVQYANSLAKAQGGSATRLGGTDRYLTSMAIAKYAVANLGFAWDGVAFASGRGPYDSLGGGVVQGKEKSVLLLADEVDSDSVDVISQNGGRVSTCLKFFGSSVVVPVNVRSKICLNLGFSYYANTVATKYSISRSRMADLQVARGESQSWSAFYNALDPDNYSYGSSEYYQFAELDHGWSGVSASTMNSFVSSNCYWSEQNYGRKSNLVNQGSAFVAAAKASGVNEVYLLSHAIWESGWGCSELAGGWTPSSNGEVVVNGVHYPYYKGVTYYNFYGIGAVDSNALSGGRAMAVKEGWTSPEKAIKGAAQWIANNYLNRGYPGDQNTLYLMKWDVPGAQATGSAWHEYCTGLDSWVLGISRIMGNLYSAASKSMSSCGLWFNVPSYS